MATTKIEVSSKMCTIGCILAILVACSNLKAAQSLRISSIEVPPAVMNSSQVTLVCNYALQADQLYSVKWYKNYVEFYRFQPTESASEAQLESQSADEQLHSRHEFELDGINLNLAKSNSTHVHLRQVNLASEGTYKCEVSADSPSFATVSVERQMKVYVLPKQKLSIIDNSATFQQQQNTNNAEPTISSRSSNSVSLHNINDIINLTCHSGPSRPAAKLTWLLNDSKISPSSKWLSTRQQNISIGDPTGIKTIISGNNYEDSSHKMQLVDTKLTLSFRIQPNYLLGNQSSTAPATHNSHSKQQQQQLHSIRFRCVAEFSVEFTSEASILVSGGKTTALSSPATSQRKHARTQTNTKHQLTNEQSKSTTIRLRRPQNSVSSAQVPQSTVSNLYRWPRPAQSNSAPFSNADWRSVGLLEQPANLASDNWFPSQVGSEHLEPTGEQAPASRSPAQLSARQHSVVVWTNRQLRAQAEHIDQLLRLTHPNELEPPIIVGKILKFYDDDNDNDGRSDNGNNDDDDDGNEDEMRETTSKLADNNATMMMMMMMEPLSAESAALSRGNKNKPFELDKAPATTYDAERRASIIDVPLQPTSINQDYELNDVVQFSCISRLGRPDSSDLRKSVRLEWFINNKQITTNQVNAFDGLKFFHEKPVKLAKRRPTSARRQSDILEAEHSENIPTASPMIAESPNLPEDGFGMDPYLNHKSSVPPDKMDLDSQIAEIAAEKTLLIEFSSSLFQIKELNLKCRTTVEQPLIEYENQLIVSVPSSSQYIEVIQQQKHKINPSLRAVQHRQNGRSGYQQRNRLANKPSSGCSSAKMITMIGKLMTLITMTTIFVAIQRF